ncbi:hypothetical protein, partial [Sideroxyarcus sp. TK5]
PYGQHARELRKNICLICSWWLHFTKLKEPPRFPGRFTILFRQQMDSHPSPRERLARLDAFHVGEYAPTSKLVRYAEGFFADILSYANSLDDTALAMPLQDLY